MAKKTKTAQHQIQKTEEAPKWDVAYTVGGEITHAANVKRYQMRDGLAKAQLEQRMMTHFPDPPDDDDDKAVNQSLEEMYLINHYPLLVYGIAEHVGFEVPLTVEGFWALPEEFATSLAEAIRRENPQYAIPFLELRKMILRLSTPTTDQPSSDTAPSAPSDKTA